MREKNIIMSLAEYLVKANYLTPEEKSRIAVLICGDYSNES